MTSERNAELNEIRDVLKECMNRLEKCTKEEEQEAYMKDTFKETSDGLTNAYNILDAMGKVAKARLLITYACYGEAKDE